MSLLPPALSGQLVRDLVNQPGIRGLVAKQLRGVSNNCISTVDAIRSEIGNNYLVHVTTVMPASGTILARVKYSLPNEIGLEMQQIFTSALSIVRPTTHFSVNATMSLHKANTLSGAEIVIMLPVREVSESISGGYCEDIFMIGSQKLPLGSILILPESYQQNNVNEVANLPKELRVIYRASDESKEEAVARVLKMEKQGCFSPACFENPEEPLMVFRDRQKVIVSENWMKALDRPFTMHEVTPMAQLENLILGMPVYSKPPFLYSIETLGIDKVQELIGQYSFVTSSVFPTTPRQKNSLKTHEKALQEMTQLFYRSKSPEDLIRNWKIHGRSITEYDC